MVPKLFTLLKKGIPKQQIFSDIISGIIVGIIALPLAIAFAIASGVTPEKGIITAIVGGLIISIFGGSRVQIGGPTGAFIVIVFSIVMKHGLNGLYIATFMAGIILVIMGLLKLGSLLKFIPQTLITGFTSAIAVIIFTTQISDFLGLEIPHLPSEFIGKWTAYFYHLEFINYWSLMISLMTILIIVVLPKISSKIPWAFVAILATSLIVYAFKLPIDTIYTRFGNIAFAMPKLMFFTINLDVLKELFVPAISIAILGSLESLLSAVVADSMIGGKHRSNMELIAQGAANIVLPLIGGIPATGAIARTAANIKNGGRTPIAGIVHALFLLCVYLFAMPVIKYIPMATLAGVLMVVAWNMSEAKVFINSLKIDFYETVVLLTTFILTILTDLTIAIPIGFVLAIILFMKRMADSIEITPLLSTKADDDTIFSQEIGKYSKNIMIFELNGPMFFGSAHSLLSINKTMNSNYRIIILRFRYVPIMDTSALSRLNSLVKDLRKTNCDILISGANEKIEKKLLQNHILEKEEIVKTINEAVNKAEIMIKNKAILVK
ncbi:MAG: sodium-independent anion transporter [Candidatus Margulisbacteria bacterium GWF2_35_9]|nr:MAG: sodium-independent anion transporter [Candidatus Margulisbacteria bacterium GWF2_35_9]